MSDAIAVATEAYDGSKFCGNYKLSYTWPDNQVTTFEFSSGAMARNAYRRLREAEPTLEISRFTFLTPDGRTISPDWN